MTGNSTSKNSAVEKGVANVAPAKLHFQSEVRSAYHHIGFEFGPSSAQSVFVGRARISGVSPPQSFASDGKISWS